MIFLYFFTTTLLLLNHFSANFSLWFFFSLPLMLRLLFTYYILLSPAFPFFSFSFSLLFSLLFSFIFMSLSFPHSLIISSPLHFLTFFHVFLHPPLIPLPHSLITLQHTFSSILPHPSPHIPISPSVRPPAVCGTHTSPSTWRSESVCGFPSSQRSTGSLCAEKATINEQSLLIGWRSGSVSFKMSQLSSKWRGKKKKPVTRKLKRVW